MTTEPKVFREPKYSTKSKLIPQARVFFLYEKKSKNTDLILGSQMLFNMYDTQQICVGRCMILNRCQVCILMVLRTPGIVTAPQYVKYIQNKTLPN